MNDVLDLMGLTSDDFTWYEAGSVEGFELRSLPQIFGELLVEELPLTVATVNMSEIQEYDEMKVAFIFEGLFLPVLESGDFYVKPDGSYATLKRNDGIALLGILNES
ncbi:conserved hypothetical protein [Vibrio owensii]|uniref:Uncharacterized protein n=1 Tax=Vibrio owensii TaxID=696485 RepID=A0AAU9PZI5_9VIBR|nr:conserved hypothetical protein [Vibrio owensii]